jgi:hypothetical protein
MLLEEVDFSFVKEVTGPPQTRARVAAIAPAPASADHPNCLRMRLWYGGAFSPAVAPLLRRHAGRLAQRAENLKQPEPAKPQSWVWPGPGMKNHPKVVFYCKSKVGKTGMIPKYAGNTSRRKRRDRLHESPA